MGVFLFLVIRAQNFFRLLGFLRRCLRLGLLPSSGIYCLPERQTQGQKQQQVRPISIFTELILLFDKNRTSFMRRHLEGLKRKFPPKPSDRKRCALINKVFRSLSHPFYLGIILLEVKLTATPAKNLSQNHCGANVQCSFHLTLDSDAPLRATSSIPATGLC